MPEKIKTTNASAVDVPGMPGHFYVKIWHTFVNCTQNEEYLSGTRGRIIFTSRKSADQAALDYLRSLSDQDRVSIPTYR